MGKEPQRIYHVRYGHILRHLFRFLLKLGEKHFRCKIKGSYSNLGEKCRLQNRPSVAVLQLRLLCLFGVNLMISSWCWTTPALKTWTQFIRKYEL